MEEVETLIGDAWRHVAPALRDDPHALAARLARRRRAVLTCPPRAWCLAVRASDTRLNSLRASVPSCLNASSQPLTLTADVLRRLCAPVTLPASGMTLDRAAALLGTTPAGLTNARIAGTLRTRHVAGLAG